jgi:hypothetical protein
MKSLFPATPILNNNMSHSHQPNREPETDTVVKSIDPEKTSLKMPLWTLGALIGTVITLTWTAGVWINSISDRFNAATISIKELRKDMNSGFDRLDTKLDNVVSFMWSQQDQKNFTLELKIQNPSLKVPFVPGRTSLAKTNDLDMTRN